MCVYSKGNCSGGGGGDFPRLVCMYVYVCVCMYVCMDYLTTHLTHFVSG